jgi:hypothetical protein
VTSEGLDVPIGGMGAEPVGLPAPPRTGIARPADVSGGTVPARPRVPALAGALFWPLPAGVRARRMRAVRDGLILAGWLSTAFVFLAIVPAGRSLGYDAFSYWSIDFGAVYDRTTDSNYTLGAFRYAPPIAFLFAPFTSLPWWSFLWLYTAVMVGTLAWLGGRWTLALLALPPVACELYHGNIHLLTAAAVALGFRHPWTWSFVLLSKVTPGVALVWFAARREWRALATALGATIVIAAGTFLLAPTLWQDWIAATFSNLDEPQPYSVPPPLPLRLPLALLLVYWGARTDRRWTVPVGAALALPILWVHGLAVALAAVPFLRARTPTLREYVVHVGIALIVASAAVVLLGPALERVLADASGALLVWLP